MKVSEILTNCDPRAVPKGRNLSTIGWWDGYLVVRFRGRPTAYIYGPKIAEAERDTLLRVPYPDSLFQNHKTKGNWQSYKVPE